MAKLPHGYEKLEKKSNYLNASKLPQGDSKFRILGTPIAGWKYWVDKKPVVFSPDQGEPKREEPIDPLNKTKACWWIHVWDYSQQNTVILEVTQSMIKSGLEALYEDSEWGDYELYDIKINRKGDGIKSEYKVVPCSPKEISQEIKKALQDHPVRLEALYTGKDPWKDLDGSQSVEVNDSTGEVQVSPVGSSFDTLKEHLEIDGIDSAHLQSYLNALSQKSGKPVLTVIESALPSERLPKFKTAYLKFLVETEASIAV